MSIQLEVNGKTEVVDADPDMPLLWVLRDVLHLTGTKYGCGVALCGACTVHLNGAPVRACQTFLRQAEGGRVTTNEALDTPEARALRQAWRELDVPQCGYCQSGQIMQAAKLLADTRNPSDADIDLNMGANVCRCAAPGTAAAASASAGEAAAFNPFVRIAPDGIVTVICKHLDRGQGTLFALTTLVAEELDADWPAMRPGVRARRRGALQQPVLRPGAGHRRLDRRRQQLHAIPPGRRRRAIDAGG